MTTSTHSPIKKKVAAGLVAVLALGGTVGIAAPSAFAQDGEASQRQAPTQEQIDQKLARLADAVANGKITQERADAIAERIQSGEVGGRGEGRHGEGRNGEGRKGRINALTEALGIDAEALRAGLQNGQSLAEIAEANGVSTASLVDTLVSAATERINAKVADGTIDAEKAAKILDGLAEKITERINRTPGERPNA